MSATNAQFRRAHCITLALILLIACVSRLWDLRTAPPGLHQDEACNAWNAYCILKTGEDQTGRSWPIFYTRGLGENRSTLFLYWMMPFQAVGGLNVWTTRLPAAFAGILTILLLCYAVSRTVSPLAGLVAAGLLTLSPWHLQHTRWGHEASLGPLAVAATMALCVWAQLPFFARLRGAAAPPANADGPAGDVDAAAPKTNDNAPRPLRALLAGLLIGVLCYGYPAIRLFLPVLLFAAFCCTLPAWLRAVRSPRGALAIAAFAIGFAVTFGPLAYQHLTNGEVINKRGNSTWLWKPDTPMSGRLAAVAARYFEHWAPPFLLTSGDQFEPYAPPVGGEIPWYFFATLLAGGAAAVTTWRTTPIARVALVTALLYPAADLLNANHGPSVLRSFPGLVTLTFLAAYGVAHWLPWWWGRRRIYSEVFAAWMLIEAGWFGYQFFSDFSRREKVYHGYQADLVAAAEWVAPRVANVDAVFWPMNERYFNMPYIVVLVASGYDALQWQQERAAGLVDIQELYPWDYCFRFGKMVFLYPAASDRILGGVRYLKEMRADNEKQKTLFIARPEEFRSATPVQTIRNSAGVPQLIIFEHEL